MSQNRSILARFYIVFAAGVFFILLGRTAQLQLLNRDQYFKASEKNRVREVTQKAQRGLIFDRNRNILVDNRPAYSTSVIPYEFSRSDSAVTLLAEILQQSPESLFHSLEKKKNGEFIPVKLKRQIDFKLVSQLEEFRLELPGVFYEAESRRQYPAGVRAPHLFGYLGEISPDEYPLLKNQSYRYGDVMGKNGLELQYEAVLKGKPGIKYVEVDALGREIRDLPELPSRDAEPGKNLHLSLDSELQGFLEERMLELVGAAVVMDAQNGEILALLSKPDFHPELFSDIISYDEWNEISSNREQPFYNRACQSGYPPGSTYKIITAIAGLETGIIDPNQEVFCDGGFRLGRRVFRCWKTEGHGSVNFLQAMEQSCNVYFFKMMLEIGLERWTHFSRLLRFGEITGIDLPNESAGLVPDRKFLDEKYGVGGWTNGLLLNLAIGQGEVLATPLQMACLAMMVGNEGRFYRPHLVREIEDSITGDKFSSGVPSQKIPEISSGTFRRIKEGMYRVVNGSAGTGRAAWLPGVNVCGKSGTAENPHGKAHSWFIGFAPMEDPEIAFSVLVENGGSGGAVAAPIARGIVNIYFGDFKTTQ